MSSSREASEEPELMTTPENTRMSTDFDGPKEQKKKRRMSSPFHRSSRSRSRPSSIVLPKNAHLDFGSGSTPRNTPPRETPPAEGSRPQSFHAPDSWDVIPDSHQQQQPTSYSTPPRGGGLQPPERLGVLPSPAKSAFSFLPQDRDGEDIPPVPPIPDGMEERQRGRESQESARQHRVIQSIVRYSTPPAMDLEASRLMDEATFKDTPAPPTMETGRLQPSPIFGDTPTGRDAIQPDAHSVQNDSLRVLALKQMDANHHSLQSDNNALPPRSMPTHEQMEEDDDDLPPQLSHEPPQPFHRAPDISPDFGPSVPQAGEISPVISSVGLGQMEESEEEDDDGITHLDHGSLMATSQHTKGDISPMIPAATLAVSSASDGPQTRVDNAIANGFSASRDVRLGYETEQIGAGDVSPVSSHAHHGVEETTPKKIIEAHASLGTANSRQTDKVSVGSDEAFSAPGASALLGGAQSLHESGSAGQTGGGAGVRLSASPYQVLHAVQYVPSRSSLDSWEQDSVVAPSQSDGSQLGDRHDERDIPPVPPLSPSMVQLEDKTPQQHYPEPEQPTFNFASSNISTKSHPLISEPAQQEAHPSSKAEAATSGSHNRSQSLLSIISSMVPGDGVSISSASSQAGRSRPSSANRQQGSSAKSSPIPAQIIEESIPGEQRSMTVPISDDYDLYADQNGIVKDVQDEKGQPLRVAAAPVADTPEPKQKAVLGAARMTAVPKIREEDTRRYSDERPMSFISGPRDANGRPQDEISTPGSGAAQANIPPVPRIPSHQLQGHPQAKTNETLYASTPPQHEPQPKEEQQQQHFPGGVVRRQTVSPIHSSMRSEQVRTPPHSNVSPPPPSNASPPPQPSPPPALAHRPLLDEIRMQSPIQIPPLQDPRLRSPPMQDLRFQSPPMQDPRLQSPPMQDPRFQSPPVQDPRFQSPPLQDPRLQSAHLQGPRMQSPPAQDPRIQVARLQNPPTWDPSMQDPRIQDPRSPQDPKKWDPRLIADPQRQGITSGQPNLQGPRGQTQKPKQSYNTMPRMGMPRLGGASTGPPRNQYELQQQQMQHQAMDPRLNDAEYRPPAAQANTQPAKQENKGSSRPKFASVLKSLGGKSNPSAPQTSQQPTSRVDPSHSVPEGPIRSASYQSSLGDLPTEQGAPKKERRASAFGSLSSRPKSVGTESHFSQDSTRVQAADSRLDLRYPISPAPFKGIPPQQVHQGVPLSQPPQAQRISTSAVPENGKKKRFSSLGNLFSRSGTSGQSKLSKEEKKFQKTQKHSTMPQFQTPPPSQQWPQQQQPFRPQQYTLQYGPPPPAATRPFPGMQGIAPQSLSPQTMSPMSPQGGHPQGMPPRIMQPQNYQQQHQQQIPQQIPQQITQQMQQQMPQQMPPQPQVQQQQSMTNGSAYIATRQIAQTHPSQRPTRQSSQPPQISNPGIPAPNPSFEHPMHRSETTGHAPPAGYYKPDSKRMGSEHAAPSFTAVERQQPLQRQSTIPQPPANLRSVSSPSPDHVPQAITPVSQRRVSSPLAEPQYETPEIPAAYNHVAGVYTSPSTQALSHDSQATRPSPVQNGSASGRQYSDPEMQPISPQVSEQTQMAPNERNQSNSSVASVVSPISNPSPGMSAPQPASNQRPQKARMTSITEAAHQERPWNLNVREGATEQEIVRARHQQYMEQQLAAQQQLHAERTGQSPSPRPSHQSQSPSPRPPSNQQQAQQPPPSTAQGSDGFREVLPKSSPQPYPMSQAQRQSVSNHLPREQQQSPAPSVSPHQLQQSHLHPEQGVQPAAYPLPTSPVSAGPRSPVNPLAAALPPPPPPPPKLPHSPMRPAFHMNQFPAPDHQQQMEQQQQQYQPPHPEQQIEQPDYEQQPPDEPPPSYSGPGVPNEGMDKDRPRPPNIMTDAEIRGRENNGRQRQPSIGLLQHPQPASMAASPQRSSADMGADNLRRQLLEQEERALAERLQRAEIQRAETERERQERERARARARELERSVSGGGRVGSLRSVAGSGRGGWERRGSTARPVFELPAEEDDEPVMRATSFPGQEWVPQWTED
ncbi:hypothetical protein K505DRAFT_11428 [Melanomma pulvis-pyrius CBS 109.77]|uniref:Uncharacterized protein n=1 Tax=Melanomma pulvis-pyrius CBS 109.77 TaxID=1314802 RepID=A0A6A6XG93_9PLEO|nr:hypothetical protein K505DRAFT_11428 [Melanomma pulvis-pyrius CBS 109.77]